MTRKKQTFAAELPTAESSKPVATENQLFSEHAIEQFAYLLTQFPDPDEILHQAGLSRADMRRLEGDDEISTALDTRLASVQGTNWRLEPGEGSDYDLIYPQISRHIEQIINGAWAAVPYGYSVMELTYWQDKGQIGIATVRSKPFEWFAPRPWANRTDDQQAKDAIRAAGLPMPECALNYYPVQGGYSGATQFEHVHLIRPGKFFCTRRRPTDDRNPYGEAVLSRCYWAWFFRNSGWRFWARFLERFGAPLLIGQTSNNTGEMAAALAAAVQSAVAAIGADDKVSAIAPTTTGESFRHFSSAVDKRIQKVILGQTLTSDVDGQGSYAAAKVHNEVRDDRRLSDVRMVSGTIQSIIDTLLAINKRQPGSVKIVMEDEVGLEPTRAERDAKLAQAGVVKFTEAYMMRAYDFQPGDIEIPEAAPSQLTPPAAAPGGAPRGAKASLLASVADRMKFTPAQRAVESVGDAALSGMESPIPVEVLRGILKAATSPDDLAQRLADAYTGADVGAFSETLERALFAADVMGYAHTEGQQ